MITDLDDYPSHQLPVPVSTLATSDPRWTDRVYFNFHPAEGNVLVELGVGFFRNTNLVDGFALVRHGDGQISSRFQRDLFGSFSPLGAQHLHFEIVEPLRRWRATLDDGLRLSCSFEFEARTDVVEYPHAYVRRGDRLLLDHHHYVQAGRVTGTIILGGATVAEGEMLSVRDRSWGVRDANQAPRNGLMIWAPIHFEDRVLYLWSFEDPRGNRLGYIGRVVYDDGRILPLAGFAHDLEFAEYMRLAQGELTLFDVAGAVHKIHFTVDTTLYLREAGYKEGGHGESKLSGEPQSQFLDTRTVTDPGLCDNLSTFQWAGGPSGRGIFEYALGRHERYQPGRTA